MSENKYSKNNDEDIEHNKFLLNQRNLLDCSIREVGMDTIDMNINLWNNVQSYGENEYPNMIDVYTFERVLKFMSEHKGIVLSQNDAIFLMTNTSNNLKTMMYDVDWMYINRKLK